MIIGPMTIMSKLQGFSVNMTDSAVFYKVNVDIFNY